MSALETPTAPKVIYRWGGWVWYYRALSLMVYGTSIFIVPMLYIVTVDAINKPSFGTIILVPLVALLAAMWVLWAVVAFLSDRQKVARLTLLPEQAALRVGTFYFGVRTVLLSDITSVDAQEYERYIDSVGQMSAYYSPSLKVEVRDSVPLKIDLQGKFIDEEAFKSLFGSNKQHPRSIRGKYRKKTRGRIARS